MKKFLPVIILCFLVPSGFARQANVLHLKNASLTLPANIAQFSWQKFTADQPVFRQHYFGIIQFSATPTLPQKRQLQSQGVYLQQYISGKAYTVMFTEPVSARQLQEAGLRSIIPIPSVIKFAAGLPGKFPAWAMQEKDKVKVMIALNERLNMQEMLGDLHAKHYQVIDTRFQAYHIVSVQLNKDALADLAHLPYVTFIQAIPPPDVKLNDELRYNARANVLHAPIVAGGENLLGKGVVIGIGDDADITSHVDLRDRVINRSPFLYNTHGTHVSGIAAGAGIMQALYQGVAPMATVISQIFSGILSNAATYVTDYGMVVTNNSYGSITGDCEYAGTYDLYSKMLDEQALQLPELLHVFAVGNDGPFNINCNGGLPGYRSTLGGYQSAKNILDVAWGDKTPSVSTGSSYGPTADGRIKPEIAATGSDVRSTSTNDNYINDFGSSMSAPAVAGGAALLIEKYRQLNGGVNPKSSLVKAWLMNGATDIENAGPDYKSGFGWLNLNRSIEMVKTNRYLQANVAQAAINNHQITVPANTAQVKVMIYWHDPSAAVFASNSLVNDLDMEVLTPAGSTFLPWRLDSARNNNNALATRGADHINNVEQVTIDNPLAGSYTIRIRGNAINVNAIQDYVVVYDFLPATIDLTFPSVGEPLVPGEDVVINWDTWDNSSNFFTLQYSIDNGTNWLNISNTIAANQRQFTWSVPIISTSQAKLRLLRNGTALQDVSMPFVIIGQPALSYAATQCEGYFAFNWNAIGGATDYEVMLKQGASMVPVALTSATSYTLEGLQKDSIYYVSVRARINGQAGRRANALDRKPTDGNCAGSISNNDLKLDSIIQPVSGRKFTSSSITSNTLQVRVKNLDDVPANNFTVQYAINGSAFITNNVAATIPPGSTYTHTFSGIDFTATGNYTITAVVKNTNNDAVAANDTLQKVISHVANLPIVLPFTEHFESALPVEIIKDTMEMAGLGRWDYARTTALGRARTFVNSGIAHSGSKAITLDAMRYIATGNTNYVTGTFNMTNYNAATQDVRMDFWYKHHGQQTAPDNRVWIRGNDTSPWIVVYNSDSNQTIFPGIWKRSSTIEISDLLVANGQNFSASFQMRFGQHGVIGMADNEHFEGYTFDDIRLYTVANDAGIEGIIAPLQNSCALSATTSLQVRVANKSNTTINNIPIKAQADNGAIITETISSVAANTLINYTFSQQLNLASFGKHTINVWVDLPGDNYRDNDSLLNYTIINQPTITTYPYLQNFETGAGNWYADGTNTSWQFGKPAGMKINRAASGNNAWKTTLKGSYNDNELSYLYSPCFNTTALVNPYVSFSIAMDFEQCTQSVCDRAWLEYTTNGITWNKLGAYGDGTNWYNRAMDNVWDSANFRRWHVASNALPAAPSIQLRFVMQSDGSLIKEGIAIDDIHIYDRQFETYTAAPMSASIMQNVNGTSWQAFTDNNKIIASINANGNNLGATAAQTYLHTGGFGAVRHLNNQYYHNRSFTIKPTNHVLPDSVSLRLYFTDAETDTLVRANSCTACSKPADAYSLGITKYNDADDNKENGTLSDNLTGMYSFIMSDKVIKVPYDKGYYVECKVKDFSELYLNNGGISGNQPLPVILVKFNAMKQANNVVVQWTTTNELTADRYEIELARSNNEFQLQNFSRIATIAAKNQQQNTYEITDAEPNKNGARYYRLKLINKDGTFSYSEIRVVLFGKQTVWQVYPNPVKNVLQIITQAEENSIVSMQLTTMLGQVLWQQQIIATGFLSKFQYDMNKANLPAGLYVLQMKNGTQVQQFKIVKQ